MPLSPPRSEASARAPARPAPEPGATGPALDELVRLLECSSDGLLQADRQGWIRYANAAVHAELGWSDTDPAGGRHWTALLDPQVGLRRRRELRVALGRAGRWDGELLLRHGDSGAGPALPFQLHVVAHLDEAGQPMRYSALLRNRSEEHRAHQQILRQADILQAITEAIPATVVVVDGEGRYRYANRAFERYCGRAREQIIGHRAVDVLGADEIERRRPYMARAFDGEPVEFVLDYPGEHGTQWLALSCIPLKVDGVVDGFVGISQDVTREHRERARLAHLAERDALTGLLNRGGFERSAEGLMYGEGLSGLALFYVDLDHFKPVNDVHGHLVGDRVLQIVAQRLQRAVRVGDVVARLGGDEFAVLLEGIHDSEHAIAVADKVLAAVGEPFVIDGLTLRVGASIGVALGLQPQAGWRELMRRADVMLYRAKADGRGRAVAA